MGKFYYKKLRKYSVEIVLILASLMIAVTSAITYHSAKSEENTDDELVIESPEKGVMMTNIYVDVSGAVKVPGLYKALNGSRLNTFIEMGGGLSESADRQFFSRNFNLARIMGDQEKLYVPSEWEVSNGYFAENGQFQSMTLATPQITPYIEPISLNAATIEELDTLPGVGKITAQKIIDNRPFKALEELIIKKVISNSVFKNIENLISI